MTSLARTLSAVYTPLSGRKSSSAHPWGWLARTLPRAGECQGQGHRLDEAKWAGPCLLNTERGHYTGAVLTTQVTLFHELRVDFRTGGMHLCSAS